MDTDIRKLYNLLIQLRNKLDEKKDSDTTPILDKILKNQKKIEDRLRKVENQNKKIITEINKIK